MEELGKKEKMVEKKILGKKCWNNFHGHIREFNFS
jgi:hypothetical protein